MEDRRKHYKIDTFPAEIVDLTKKLIDQGWTYESLAQRLTEMGHAVGKSSVQRYGKNYRRISQKIEQSKAQSKAIVEAAAGSGLEMEEAAVQIALMHIQTFLMDMEDLQGEEASKVLMALARIQSSSVQREKLKIVWRDKASAVAEEVATSAKSEGLSDAKADEIKKKILGIAA